MVSLAVFMFGLAIGSFLNAFIYRLEVRQGLRQISRNREQNNISVMRGRSFCDSCGHQLAWHDLIPLLSFVLLKGRCRYCSQRISLQHPLVELATAFSFVALASFSQAAALLYLWAMASLLIVIFVYDLKHFLIPNQILYQAIGLVFLWRVFEFLSLGISASIIAPLLAGLGASLFFFSIYKASRGRAMGFGDVKLAFLLGLFLGWPTILVALFLAFSIGAVFGLVLIALKKKGLKSEVPFAPFLILGTAVAFFFGEGILRWYLNLFLV